LNEREKRREDEEEAISSDWITSKKREDTGK
jgi:hypothetical protein